MSQPVTPRQSPYPEKSRPIKSMTNYEASSEQEKELTRKKQPGVGHLIQGAPVGTSWAGHTALERNCSNLTVAKTSVAHCMPMCFLIFPSPLVVRQPWNSLQPMGQSAMTRNFWAKVFKSWCASTQLSFPAMATKEVACSRWSSYMLGSSISLDP